MSVYWYGIVTDDMIAMILYWYAYFLSLIQEYMSNNNYNTLAYIIAYILEYKNMFKPYITDIYYKLTGT